MIFRNKTEIQKQVHLFQAPFLLYSSVSLRHSAKTIARLCITDMIDKRTQNVLKNFASICEKKTKGFSF